MIAVVGFGNVLREDDGVGIHIIQKLERMQLPTYIKIIDGGNRGMDVFWEIGEFEKLIIIDSVMTEGKEGVLHRITPSELPVIKDPVISTHDLSWVNFLKNKVASDKEEQWTKVIIYGIEIKKTHISMRLSPRINNKLAYYINSILEELQ